MAKGAKQPKIKLAQPIALEPNLRDVLEKHGVRKPPTVDKVEALEKAAVAKKWLFFITPDRKDGLTHVKLEVPGPDGLLYFEATALTTALAMTQALCDALENGPQQADMFDERAKADPNGTDLPMFRGNGGVAAVALDQIVEEVKEEIRAGAIDGVTINESAEPQIPNPWTFLFIVNPADVTLWKAHAPDYEDNLHADRVPVVDWEEGDELNDRGWYLDPSFAYDANAGEIRLLAPDGTPDELVWSREVATKADAKAAKKSAKPNASNVTADQAEALRLAGAQTQPVS